MASFKGDENYRVYHDDCAVDSSASDDEFSAVPHDANRSRRRWLEEHFDVLQDLYAHLREDGERVFGRAFLQRGGFHTFVQFVYEHTQII